MARNIQTQTLQSAQMKREWLQMQQPPAQQASEAVAAFAQLASLGPLTIQNKQYRRTVP